MRSRPLADTGLLVALINPKDVHHEWAKDVINSNLTGFSTCEAVISEAIYLLRQSERAKAAIIAMIESDWLEILPVLPKFRVGVNRILESYHPNADFADACLVALYEELGTLVYTTDKRDFTLYKVRSGKLVKAKFPT